MLMMEHPEIPSPDSIAIEILLADKEIEIKSLRRALDEGEYGFLITHPIGPTLRTYSARETLATKARLVTALAGLRLGLTEQVGCHRTIEAQLARGLSPMAILEDAAALKAAQLTTV